MHQLESEVFALCRDNGLFAAGDRLVLGVSGGPDSMALLQVMARLAPQLGVCMVVAHVDHGLRPTEAGYEESLVRGASAALGLECQVAHLEVATWAQEQGASLEEAARDLRYELFWAMAKAHDANKIVVAHTADDQAEEILLRLIRGSGRKGLSGMSLLREGRVVRPFLTTEKSRILSYLQEREVAFAVDSSNADRRYLRNKIRLDLLPYLAQFNPNIKQTLRQTASILRDEDALLDAMVLQEYALLVCEGMTPTGPKVTVVCAEFNQRPLAIRRRLVEKMLNYLGAKFGYRQIDILLTLAAAGKSARLHLKKGLLVLTKRGEMHFCYPAGRQAGRQKMVDDTVAFSLLVPQPGCYLIPEIGRKVLVEIMATMPSHAEISCGHADFFDAETMSFPLVLRNRLPGDRFQPMNSQGRKKVAEFLIDLKVPVAQRNRMPVVLSANQIVAILGGRVADGVKVTAKTTRVLRIISSSVFQSNPETFCHIQGSSHGTCSCLPSW